MRLSWFRSVIGCGVIALLFWIAPAVALADGPAQGPAVGLGDCDESKRPPGPGWRRVYQFVESHYLEVRGGGLVTRNRFFDYSRGGGCVGRDGVRWSGTWMRGPYPVNDTFVLPDETAGRPGRESIGELADRQGITLPPGVPRDLWVGGTVDQNGWYDAYYPATGEYVRKFWMDERTLTPTPFDEGRCLLPLPEINWRLRYFPFPIALVTKPIDFFMEETSRVFSTSGGMSLDDWFACNWGPLPPAPYDEDHRTKPGTSVGYTVSIRLLDEPVRWNFADGTGTHLGSTSPIRYTYTYERSSSAATPRVISDRGNPAYDVTATTTWEATLEYRWRAQWRQRGECHPDWWEEVPSPDGGPPTYIRHPGWCDPDRWFDEPNDRSHRLVVNLTQPLYGWRSRSDSLGRLLDVRHIVNDAGRPIGVEVFQVLPTGS